MSDFKEVISDVNPAEIESDIVAKFTTTIKARTIYKIPVADFSNVNGLVTVASKAYTVGKDSEELNLLKSEELAELISEHIPVEMVLDGDC